MNSYRRAINLQAISWQERDLLEEIHNLREALNEILILDVSKIDEAYIIAGKALAPN